MVNVNSIFVKNSKYANINFFKSQLRIIGHSHEGFILKIARFSQFGFILAAAGSAVGLGNIWKFPYITGEFGGGAFVFVYLVTVLLIGLAVMMAEIMIGYMGRLDSVSSFEKLAPQHKQRWKYAGFMAITGLLILSFYSVVIGWIFHYIFISLTHLPQSVDAAKNGFGELVSRDITAQLFYHTLSFIIITAIVLRGIKGGIEKINTILMPMLILILVGMFMYATSLGGFDRAWDFMFTPDWSKINSEALVSAVGHAFFTLSLGMASIMTYSASLPKHTKVVKTSLIIVSLDTGIALVAGLMLFTFLYEYGSAPAAGPGLVFISLPAVFSEMGVLGIVFALLFFLGLAFAGLTSAVSLLEPTVQYLIDRYRMTRFKAVLGSGLSFYLIGIVALLANTDAFSSLLSFGGKNVFDWLDFITASILLPVGGLVMAVFVGFVIPKRQLLKAFEGSIDERNFVYWRLVLRYVVPPALVVVMLNLLGLITIEYIIPAFVVAYSISVLFAIFLKKDKE